MWYLRCCHTLITLQASHASTVGRVRVPQKTTPTAGHAQKESKGGTHPHKGDAVLHKGLHNLRGSVRRRMSLKANWEGSARAVAVAAAANAAASQPLVVHARFAGAQPPVVAQRARTPHDPPLAPTHVQHFGQHLARPAPHLQQQNAAHRSPTASCSARIIRPLGLV